MRITARPIKGKPGCVELLINGKTCEEIRCKQGSARISGSGMISLTALITCPTEPSDKKTTSKEITNENIGREKNDMDT